MKPFARFFCHLLMPMLCLICSDMATAAGSKQHRKPVPILAGSPDTIIFLYDRTPGEIAEADPQPLLRVYADGRVRLHYPRISKKAGDYEVYLDNDEMQELLRTVSGIAGFDAETVKRQQAEGSLEVQRQDGIIYAVSDDTVTRFELLVNGLSETADRSGKQGRKSVVWTNLGADFNRYPNIDALQSLSATDQALRRWLKQLHRRDDLVKVNDVDDHPTGEQREEATP